MRTSVFANLEELQISLGPDYMPLDMMDGVGWPNAFECGEMKALVEGSDGVGFPTVAPVVREAMEMLRKCLPPECKVVWKFDRAGMPGVSPPGRTGEGARLLADFNEVVGWMWKHTSFLDDETCDGKGDEEGHGSVEARLNVVEDDGRGVIIGGACRLGR